MNPIEAFIYAEENLPDDWKLNIEIEDGLVMVELHCPTWEKTPFEGEDEWSIADQIVSAVNTAIKLDPTAKRL